MREITLDARLARAFEMVPECRVCADIGADHGFLSAQLLMSGRVQRMHICDISAPSLDKARRLFAGDALESRAVFGVDMKIVDGDDRDLPAGEIGAICVRLPLPPIVPMPSNCAPSQPM